MLPVVSRGHEMRPALLRGKLRVAPLQQRGEPAEDGLELIALGTEPLHLGFQLHELPLGSRVGAEPGQADTGMLVLEPGETLRTAVVLTPEL